MKTKLTSDRTISFKILITFILFLIVITGSAQNGGKYRYKSIQDVISWYKGWLGDPDTLKVFIDSTFTNAQKDSIKAAINRWNGADGKPKLKQVTSPPADITFTTDDGLDDNTAGETTLTHDGNGKTSKAKVAINPNHPGLGLGEIATHELGHCLGLDDTDEDDNPDDVMKGAGGSNGSDGGLSKHDSAELKSALTAQSKEKKHALAPSNAVIPGTHCSFIFDLGQTYPPSAGGNFTINPVMDPDFIVENMMVNGNLLQVDAFLGPSHWLGNFYLDVSIVFLPPYGTNTFLGWHFANNDPYPPTTFTCPFQVQFQNGLTIVDWQQYCTYPNPDAKLRSHLTVDNSIVVLNKGMGRYILHLAPGTYTFTLDVDDFQQNSASFSQTVTVTGTNDKISSAAPFVYPNPFSQSCKIICDEKSSIDILDINGIIVGHLNPGQRTWAPGSDVMRGVYFMKVISGTEVKMIKIVYTF